MRSAANRSTKHSAKSHAAYTELASKLGDFSRKRPGIEPGKASDAVVERRRRVQRQRLADAANNRLWIIAASGTIEAL